MSSRRCSRSSSHSATARGTLAALLAAGLLATLSGCTETEDVFPANTTLAIGVVNRGLTSQQAATPGNQVTVWTVEDATVTTASQTYDFADSTCTHQQVGALLLESLALDCDQIGFSVGTGQQLTATVSLTISQIEIRRAEIPDLAMGGDVDNDMVLNEDDNCPIIPNPMQEDGNGDGVGDLCSVLIAGEFFPDQDEDDVRDLSDNCKWVANMDQADANSDFVGDACEQVVILDYAPGNLQLDLGPITVTPRGGAATVLEVDFDERQTLTCDPAFTSCTLDPAAVVLTEVQATL